MRKIEINELKQIQLYIMDFIHDICEKNEIKYWLEFGSLIGAVRHKGYIPWDDDIDIGMLREDYIKFCTVCKDPDNRYVLHNVDNDNHYNFLFGKVYDTRTVEKDGNAMEETCVNVDIFVFDDIPGDKIQQKKMFNKRDYYRKLNNIQTKDFHKKNIIKTMVAAILKGILNIWPKNYFLKKFQTKMMKNNGKEIYAANLCGYSRYIFEKADVEKTLLVPFEDRKYRIPEGYDRMLTTCFGNYMKLPPEDKRVPAHKDIEVFMKE